MVNTAKRARLQGVVGAFEKDPERDFYCFDFEGGYHQGSYRKCKILNIKVVVEHSDGLLEMDLDDLKLSDPNASADLPAVAGKVRRDVGCLDDARKGNLPTTGQAMLYWGFTSNIYAKHAVRLPEEVVDQILVWRDQFIAPNA